MHIFILACIYGRSLAPARSNDYCAANADTMAAITGSVAGAYYGIPAELEKKIATYLDGYLLDILADFKKKFM